MSACSGDDQGGSATASSTATTSAGETAATIATETGASASTTAATTDATTDASTSNATTDPSTSTTEGSTSTTAGTSTTSVDTTGEGTTTDTTGDPGGYFPIDYDVSQIEVLETQDGTVNGEPYRLTLYRNNAYRCGRTNYHTFLVVEPIATIGQPAPLWVYLRGGGVGYYDGGGTYVGDESLNDEWTLGVHANALYGVAFTGGINNPTTKATIVGKRVEEGWRLVSPSFCDHDLYVGMGQDYPNNPHWNGEDTVDGLLATMAAIDFSARGNGQLEGHHATHVFVHGSSAGSPGTYAVTHAFGRAGVHLTGAVLDAFILSGGLQPLFDEGCTEIQQAYPGFDIAEATAKNGPFAGDPALFLDATLPAALHDTPSYALLGGQDGFCCGAYPAVAGAVADGYDNNCEWAYRAPFAALDDAQSPLYDYLYLKGKGHVLTKDPDATVHAPLEAWFQAVMATNPAPPWP